MPLRQTKDDGCTCGTMGSHKLGCAIFHKPALKCRRAPEKDCCYCEPCHHGINCLDFTGDPAPAVGRRELLEEAKRQATQVEDAAYTGLATRNLASAVLRLVEFLEEL